MNLHKHINMCMCMSCSFSGMHRGRLSCAEVLAEVRGKILAKVLAELPADVPRPRS